MIFPDLSSQSSAPSYVNYTLISALTEYVAKATELKLFSPSALLAGNSAANATFNSDFGRLANFMILNGEGILMQYLWYPILWYLGEFAEKLDSDYKSFYIVLVTDPIVIVMLMMMFIPFIIRVQSSLLRIYVHMCKFKEEDIRAWLEACSDSRDIIKASAANTRRAYCSTSFDVTLINPDSAPAEEKKAVSAAKPTELADEKPTSTIAAATTGGNAQTDDVLLHIEEDKVRLGELVRSRQADKEEAKQKTFLRTSREKTRIYMLFLVMFGAFIGISRAVDIAIFLDMRNGFDQGKQIYNIIITREINNILSVTFFREEILINSPLAFTDCTRATFITAVFRQRSAELPGDRLLPQRVRL